MASVNLPNEVPAEVNQAEFAAIRGVKPPLVTRWKQRGLLVMSDDGQRVRVAESIARLDANLHPGRGGDRTGRQRAASGRESSQGLYSIEAAREKRASAQLKELELAKAAQKVVDAALAREATLKRVQAAKALWRKMPRRLAPVLAMKADPLEIERILTQEFEDAFRALASGLDAGQLFPEEAVL